MRRIKKFVAELTKSEVSYEIFNGLCNTCILIFQYLTLVILQLNCRSILRSELDKIKEEKNKLDELNMRQNLELQNLRYVRVRINLG